MSSNIRRAGRYQEIDAGNGMQEISVKRAGLLFEIIGCAAPREKARTLAGVLIDTAPGADRHRVRGAPASWRPSLVFVCGTPYVNAAIAHIKSACIAHIAVRYLWSPRTIPDAPS